MDKASAIGLTLAAAGILGGLTLDGGNIGQILQPTAAMIVLGGTLGAVMLQYPMNAVLESAQQVKTVFTHKEVNLRQLIDQIIGFANKARKNGIVSLDNDLESIGDPFLKKTLMLAVDGVQPAEIRETMEFELGLQAERGERNSQVFDSAGGFAPTIGILGAIMGLIQVMQHLDNIDEVGRGIAVAFVATIYGVASANLLFLPIAGKLRGRRREAELAREIMLEGVVAIVEGVNPRMLQTKLAGFLPAEAGEAPAGAGAGARAAAETAPEPEMANS